MSKLKLILSIIVLITLTPIFSHAKLTAGESVVVSPGMYERKFKKVSYKSIAGSPYGIVPPQSGTYDEWSPYLIIAFHSNGTPAYIRESDGGGNVHITYHSTEGDEIMYTSEIINNGLSNMKYMYGIVFKGGIESQFISFIEVNQTPSDITQKIVVNCKEF